MFKIYVIKNTRRTKKNQNLPKEVADCSIKRPDERGLPYFSIVIEQVLSDERYLSLTEQEQGAFWRLMVHVFASDMGLVVRHEGMIAKRLGISVAEWRKQEALFLQKGLLIVTEDGIYLLQHELREQLLQTLEACNAKRR
jgi:hypothetical protein